MNTKPLLLDGAMGQEIVNRGGKSGYGEWAVAALHETPDIVLDIHRDYIKAGADVITTNTYSTTRTRLAHVNMEDRLGELVQVAATLAMQARDESQRDDIQIAGSIGPLEGSYINEFNLSYDEMVKQFDELMHLLAPYVDIYLGETFSTIIEARAFLTAAQRHDKAVWVSYTLNDQKTDELRGGESLQEAIEAAKQFNPDVILLNCCRPESINQRIDDLKAANIPFGGFANGFQGIPALWQHDANIQEQLDIRDDLSPQVYNKHVMTWLDAGASVVGGCCDIGPAHIAELRRTIDAQSA